MTEQKSIWNQEISLAHRERLSEDIHADAAVIGGGMAGILTAHFLKAAGVRAVVLEANRVGSGQTGRTTAKITSQHGLIYEPLIYHFGMERAQQYADANEAAIREYRRMAKEQDIPCDFVDCASCLYAVEDWQSIAREYEAAEKLGLAADYREAAELPFAAGKALFFQGQAHFHPLKFLKAVAEPLVIYEQTRVLHVEKNQVYTTGGRVTAEHIVFCSHYPFQNFPGYYFLRMHQERSYVLALEHAGKVNAMYYGVDGPRLSLRMQGEMLLLGGEGHRTGKNEGGRYQRLRDAARSYWPQSREILAWSAQDCMPMDKVPYIGRFSRATPNWYVATGFQKWGMSSSMAAAMILSDLIVKGENPWADVFSPQRFYSAASAAALLQNTVQAAKGLVLGAVAARDGCPHGKEAQEPQTAQEGAKAPRCPHLGCRLAWNPDEKTWDCPCHGSRFDSEGRILEGPAQNNLGETEELPEKK